MSLVAFGDSKTRGNTCCVAANGYRNGLITSLTAVPLPTPLFTAVQAVIGQTIAQARAAVDAWTASYPSTPGDWVFVNLGTNDMLTGMPSQAQQESDLAYVLDALHTKFPGSQFIVSKPWYTTAGADATTLATRIDNVLSTRAAWTRSINESTFLSGLIDVDGIHPNAAGYAATAAAIKTSMGY